MITFKQFINEGIEDRGILKAIFIVGSPGAGKSYTVKQLVGQIHPVIVNTDKAVEHLTTKNDDDDFDWAKYRDHALRITKNQLSNYLNGLLPLFIDGTSNSVSNILHRIGILESLGYDVGLVHVTADWESVVNRLNIRNDAIKRKVDIEFAKNVYSQAEENVSFLKSKVAFFKEFKNSQYDTMSNEELLEIYKDIQKFFTAPIINPVGKRSIESLKASKEKYLIPSLVSKETLANKVNGWYRE